MTKRRLAILAVAMMIAGCGSSARAVAELTIDGAWARSTPPGATQGVVYLRITSPIDDALVAARVSHQIAHGVKIHDVMGTAGTSPMANMPQMAEDGEMAMVPIDSVALQPGVPVVFKPGGKHFILSPLAKPLVSGDHFTLTLWFASGNSRPVDVLVTDNPPGGG